MKTKRISRRQFVKGTGALIVSFNFFGPVSRALAQAGNFAGTEPEATSLDSWIAVAQDGSVTVFTSKVDLGTGVVTALSQIVAEELDVPFHQIRMETGDTAGTIDQAATVGSRTIERGGPQLRQASAAARQQLLKLASVKLGTPVEKLTVTDGVVSVSGDPAKKVSYANLIGGKHFDVKITATGAGAAMIVAPEVRPKDHKDYKIVGQPVHRVDLPPKFTGEFVYTPDVRVPGMLHGRVVRPPVVNSKPLNVDESSIGHIAGVVKIVQQGSFVGVVANTEWSAIQASRALKVTWSTPGTKLPANNDELQAYLKNTKSFTERVVANKGNLEPAFSQAARTFEATYHWPFQLHGMIGPSCAVADVQGDKVTIWAGSQGTFNTRKQVADMLNLPERNIRVVYRESSGCYGRLSPDDVPLDAALMSRAVGKPVRVQWMREDEHGWEPKGPAQLMTARAGVDAQGKVIAWDFLDRSFPWTTNGMPLLAARQVGLKPTGQGNMNGTDGGGEIYAFENQKVAAAVIPWIHPDPTPLRTSNLRAPGDLARSFASESFVDEVASGLAIDPVQFRLRYLSTNKRPMEALLAATKRAGWQERPSHSRASSGSKATGRGVAVANRSNTMTAAVAEVEVDKSTGKILVKRVVLAHDCGLIVNPDGLANQIQGNVIQGVSRTLMEEVKFDEAGVKNLDWASYPIITFQEAPDVVVELINRTEMEPLGGGEPSIVPVPAAVGNAVFDAIGVRLREVPFTPERVLAALKSDAASYNRLQ
jgi:CO/xanthine dehydrogenase Mo-binding subunit